MATSYDDIVRRTVPEPDSSFRPTKEQEKQAKEGFRMLDQDEQTLLDNVVKEVARFGIDVEVERTRVILRGHVASGALYTEAEERARAVEGVSQVENDLVIRA